MEGGGGGGKSQHHGFEVGARDKSFNNRGSGMRPPPYLLLTRGVSRFDGLKKTLVIHYFCN